MNYLSYLGQQFEIPNSHVNQDFLDGYEQAKRDIEIMLKDLAFYSPSLYNDP
jgi:hypothetical protein